MARDLISLISNVSHPNSRPQGKSHLEHMENLETYLRIAPHLIPNDNDVLLCPTMRHPDLQPNNAFVSDDLDD